MGGSKITRPAGHYPYKLCREIVEGALNQFDFETRRMVSQEDENGSMNSKEVLAAEADRDGEAPQDDVVSESDDSLADIDVPSNKMHQGGRTPSTCQHRPSIEQAVGQGFGHQRRQ